MVAVPVRLRRGSHEGKCVIKMARTCYRIDINIRYKSCRVAPVELA